MNFIHGMNIPINHEDPMKGIFYRMFKYIDIIEKGMAYSLQSSIYNGDSNNYQNASYLLRRKETPGWLSSNTPNSNFELIFPSFLFELSGYGMMQEKNNDEITRSWNFSCIKDDEDKEILLFDIFNTSIFCSGKTGHGNTCGTYDKKAFEVNKTVLCNHFKFVQTGKNGRMVDFFGLSGVEFFGKVFYMKYIKCPTNSRKIKNTNIIMFIMLIK